jgi:N-acetylmuramoyl-L-alanine amidase
MPSILAELSFISNPVEEKRLRLPAYRQRMAEGLFEGIRNYLNSVQIASAR